MLGLWVGKKKTLYPSIGSRESQLSAIELVQQWLNNNFIGQLKWHLHGLVFRLEH